MIDTFFIFPDAITMSNFVTINGCQIEINSYKVNLNYDNKVMLWLNGIVKNVVMLCPTKGHLQYLRKFAQNVGLKEVLESDIFIKD